MDRQNSDRDSSAPADSASDDSPGWAPPPLPDQVSTSSSGGYRFDAAFDATAYEGTNDTPRYDPATYESPGYGASYYETPGQDSVGYEVPTYEIPTYEAPTYEAPTYDASDYRTSDYRTADFSGSDYRTSDYRATDYRTSNLSGSNLSGPNFSGASYRTSDYRATEEGSVPRDATGPHTTDHNTAYHNTTDDSGYVGSGPTVRYEEGATVYEVPDFDDPDTAAGVSNFGAPKFAAARFAAPDTVDAETPAHEHGFEADAPFESAAGTSDPAAAIGGSPAMDGRSTASAEWSRHDVPGDGIETAGFDMTTPADQAVTVTRPSPVPSVPEPPHVSVPPRTDHPKFDLQPVRAPMPDASESDYAGWGSAGSSRRTSVRRKVTSDDLGSDALLNENPGKPVRGGWRRGLQKLTANVRNPGDPTAAQRIEAQTERVRQPIRSDYRIAILSLKGGVGKTTVTVGLGSTFASLRGDNVVAVDANPDFGTLSERVPQQTKSTVRDLLAAGPDISRYSDVREHTSQAPSRLEVLGGERDPAASEAFTEADYRGVIEILRVHYNLILTDCGTGIMHSAMSGVLSLAHSLVLVSSPAVDGARSAAATLDWLGLHGYSHLVERTVVVISAHRPGAASVDMDELTRHFLARCRAVVVIPFDEHLAEGSIVDLERLRPRTRRAFLDLAAMVSDDFPDAGGRHSSPGM